MVAPVGVSMKRTVIAFHLIASIFIILLCPSTIAVTLAIAIIPGGLKVVLQRSPYPIVKGTQTSLKISFYQKRTGIVQPHIYYDVRISKAGKQLFDAVSQAGYVGNLWLHSSEGIITIPYTFQGPGVYSVNVTIFGILFIPVNPESALFKLNVTEPGT
jgi:hypothetical protein